MSFNCFLYTSLWKLTNLPIHTLILLLSSVAGRYSVLMYLQFFGSSCGFLLATNRVSPINLLWIIPRLSMCFGLVVLLGDPLCPLSVKGGHHQLPSALLPHWNPGVMFLTLRAKSFDVTNFRTNSFPTLYPPKYFILLKLG